MVGRTVDSSTFDMGSPTTNLNTPVSAARGSKAQSMDHTSEVMDLAVQDGGGDSLDVRLVWC